MSFCLLTLESVFLMDPDRQFGNGETIRCLTRREASHLSFSLHILSWASPSPSGSTIQYPISAFFTLDRSAWLWKFSVRFDLDIYGISAHGWISTVTSVLMPPNACASSEGEVTLLRLQVNSLPSHWTILSYQTWRLGTSVRPVGPTVNNYTNLTVMFPRNLENQVVSM